ncbi:DSBA oxidoreductase [Coniochaeta ligniaria NRRL 30616]|uniref:DSBA oxidoreductase n=1 Tax=Coniochaeta ligniaria NRRL 30616 TaxID=1408157 RepID=A0A1J7IGJ8_9PEZI|nr:DSBA oxidoreductase [Coniochaeta ligniaria NRRL 30616]
MTNFKIDVISDPICPWCYVGKNRLEKAIDIYKKVVPNGEQDTFTVTWHPFYLDPTLPKKGTPAEIHMANKFGAERAKMMNARLQQMGAAEGLPFKARGNIGHTRDAHRLLQLAKRKGPEVQNKVVAQLFQAHMEEGLDITSHEMLVDVAAKGGLDKDEAKKWLDEGKGGDDVDREVQEAYAKGVQGVPNFTVNDKYVLEGAQDPQTFLQTFVRAKAEAPEVSAGSADTC